MSHINELNVVNKMYSHYCVKMPKNMFFIEKNKQKMSKKKIEVYGFIYLIA